MGDYLLGIDAGNTVIKAVIFDRTGRELAHAGEEGHSRMPCPGHVERDLGELWTNAKQVIRTCLDKAGVAASDIAAIGCAAAGTGVGLFADFTHGAAAMVRVDREYRPNGALAAHYNRRYALYKDITDAMMPIWRRLSAPENKGTGVAA
ncbi:sugar (pentulose or hexulose) kinase [Sinorhizobium fredii]